MEQDPQVNERLLQRRRFAGLPENAGRLSNARFNDDGSPILERSDPRVQSRFGHILGGALKNKIEQLDQQESTLFSPPARINTNSEYGEGGRTPAAITKRDNSMPTMDRRKNQRRGPQQPTQKVSDPQYSVQLDTFQPARDGSEMSVLSQIEAMFGGGGGRYSSTSHRGPQGPLMPERGHNSDIDLGGYASSAPFNPMSQILNRVSARSSRGVDYREMESQQVPMQEYDDQIERYSTVGGRRDSAHHNPQLMQEMARTMAEEMIRAFMQDNKGKKYYKEVKTTHTFDSPTAKLVEIDGKYYKMDLKPVKITKR